jgi:hypothetical protein
VPPDRELAVVILLSRAGLLVRAAPSVLVGLLALGSLGVASAADPEPVAAVTTSDRNPHDRPDDCGACHEPGDTPSAPGAPRPSLESCVECHPDQERDMHAVDMAPEKTRMPAGWPFDGGVVTCATCHAEPSCETTRSRQKPWLRGGPYADPLDACWACHDTGDYERTDPHHPTTVRDAADGSCAACHTAVPEEGAVVADSSLRATPDQLCALCHDGPPHLGAESHMGAKHEGPPPEHGLPLGPGGSVACWTCHEVHGDGLNERAKPPKNRRLARAIIDEILGEEWAGLVPDGAVWPGTTNNEEHPPLLALPAADGRLCEACHGDGPGAGDKVE